MTIVLSVVIAVAVFSLMIFVHEFGHFVVGKKAGVRVREFGFGFPLAADKPPEKRPLSWKIWEDKSGTVYTVNLIPFGGFVNLGENDPDDPRSLVNFPRHVRLAALLAGPFMNLVLAFIIFALTALIGYPEFIFGVGIYEVVPGSPADEAGLRANDIILRVGDLDLSGFTSDVDVAEKQMIQGLVDYVAARAGRSLPVVVQRGIGPDAPRIETAVVPKANELGEGKMGVSIAPMPVRLSRVRASFPESLRYSLSEILYTIELTFLIPLQVLRGILPAGAARAVGPVGVAVMTGNAVQQSIKVDWAYPIMHLAGVLNVAIAMTNLLPLPALDGGRIFFIILEMIRGKPLPPEKENLVHGIGLLLLLTFLLLITIQDIFVPLPKGIDWSDYLY